MVAAGAGRRRRRATASRCCSIRRCAEKLAACGISLLDTPQEVFPAALAYLGLDPKSRDLGDLDKAAALLDRIRPYVRKFHSSQYINDLATGDICIALGYSGDVIQARNRAARGGERGRDRLPRAARRGADVDRHARHPQDAPHPDNALASSITSCARRSSPRSPTRSPTRTRTRRRPRWSSRRSATTPAIYPPDAVRQLFYVDLPAPRDYERARTRAWNRVKSGG